MLSFALFSRRCLLALLLPVLPVLLCATVAQAATADPVGLADAAGSPPSWQGSDLPEPPGDLLPTGLRRVRVPKVEAGPKVDGWLDEAVWSAAEPLELDFETGPAENARAQVRTVCRVLHTSRSLYYGCHAYDDPNDIRARFTDRDQSWEDDTVGIALDPFNEKNVSLVFDVNPLGVQNDRRYTEQDGKSDSNWDVLWDSAGRLVEDGYVVEAEIPFSSLPFPASSGEQVWGFNFRRQQPREVYRRLSILPHDRSNPCRTCQQWELIGFDSVEQGRNLEITPTLTGVQRARRDGFPDGELRSEDPELDPGISLDWGITSNMRLGVTVNPDFSQVEADDARLDVNESFALFFEERRPFFLRSADRFRTEIQAVHTRSIADPDFATRFTGDIGANSVAILAARDASTSVLVPGVESSSLGFSAEESDAVIVSLRRGLGDASSIGLLVTDRSASDYRNTVAGLDGRLRLAQKHRVAFQLLGSQSRIGSEFATQSGLEEQDIDDWAFEGEYVRESRNWVAELSYEDYGDDFRADLGFVTRVGTRGPEVELRRRFYGGAEDWYTKLEVQVEASRKERSNGLLHADRKMLWASYEGALQSRFSLGYFHADRLFQGTRFDLDGNWMDFRMRPSSAFQFGLSAGYHDEIDVRGVRKGHQTRMTPWINLTPGRRTRFSMRHTLRSLDLDQGELFTAQQSEVRGVYQWNSRTFLRAIVQWTELEQNTALFADPVDPRRADLFGQFLFTYRLDPQTALYLGYSLAGLEVDQILETGGDSLGLTDGSAPVTDSSMAQRVVSTGLVETGNAVFFKVGYTWKP